MVFAATMLIRGNSQCAFTMGKGQVTNVFVTDLKFSRHQLDNSSCQHGSCLVFWGYTRQLWSARLRQEPNFEYNIAQLSVNVIEERVLRGCFIVGKNRGS